MQKNESLIESADVVVVGMGSAGISAAIEAHDAGATVVVLEKTTPAESGGNFRVSGQVWFCPTDTEAAKRHLRAMSGEYPVDEGVLDAWARETSRNTEWMQARIAEVGGRFPRDPDDSYTGDGTDISRHSFGTFIAGRHGVDFREHEYPEVEGNECGTEYNYIGPTMGFSRLWSILSTALHDRGITVLYETRATELLEDSSGRIAGIVVSNAEGAARTIRVRRGVVLATGGFGNNSEMARKYLRLSHVTPWGNPSCTGDGIRLGQRLGADLDHPYQYQGVMGVATPEFGTGENATPQDCRFITVGSDGRRFMNESLENRHGKTTVRGFFDFHPAVPMWTVFDEDGRLAGPLVPPRAHYAVGWNKQFHRYDWSMDNSAEIERGWIIKADTISELAEKLGIDASGLDQEVKLYNQYVAQGSDPQFGRPVRDQRSIQRGPFYGYRWAQLLISTHGGLRKDEQARVIRVDDTVIPGLFAAGDTASTYTWCFSGGMPNGDALAFGRIAGRNAAAAVPVDDIAATAAHSTS